MKRKTNCLLCRKYIPENSGHEVKFSTNVTFPELRYEDGKCYEMKKSGDKKVCHTCHEEQREFMTEKKEGMISLIDILHGKRSGEW